MSLLSQNFDEEEKDLTDKEILEQFPTSVAIKTIYKRYRLRIVQRLMSIHEVDIHTAEDAYHETFLQMLDGSHMPRIIENTTIYPSLLRASRVRLHRLLVHKVRNPTLSFDASDDGDSNPLIDEVSLYQFTHTADENSEGEKKSFVWVDADTYLEPLRSTLEAAEYSLMEQLFALCGGRIRMSYAMLSAEPTDIASTLREFSKTVFVREGRLVLPPSPLRDVTFPPLQLFFERRDDYGGDLLVYFQSHACYQGLTRYELEQFDPPFYAALVKAQLIKKVITESYFLNTAEVEKICSVHEEAKGRPSEGVRLLQKVGLKVVRDTVVDHWKKHGLAIRTDEYTESQIQKICDLHTTCNGNSAEAARILTAEGFPITYPTVIQYWKKANLPINVARKNRFKDPNIIAQLIAMYDASNGIIADARRMLLQNGIEISAQILAGHWQKAGLVVIKFRKKTDVLPPANVQLATAFRNRSSHASIGLFYNFIHSPSYVTVKDYIHAHEEQVRRYLATFPQSTNEDLQLFTKTVVSIGLYRALRDSDQTFDDSEALLASVARESIAQCDCMLHSLVA